MFIRENYLVYPVFSFIHYFIVILIIYFLNIPLLILVSFVLLKGLPTFICVSLIITILSGIGIWIIGRPGFHVGASGLIMGYWSYLIFKVMNKKILFQSPLLLFVFIILGDFYFIFFRPKDFMGSSFMWIFSRASGSLSLSAADLFY